MSEVKDKVNDILDDVLNNIEKTEEEIIETPIEDKIVETDNEDLFDDMEEEDEDEKELNNEELNKELNLEDNKNSTDENIIKNEDDIINKDVNTTDEEERLNERVLVIVNSPNYDLEKFPNFKELKELLIKNKDIFFIEIGGIVDKISFGTEIKCFLHTTLKHHHMKEFNSLNYPDDERVDKFNNFILEKCIIAPKQKIEDYSAGEYYVLLQHIKSKSYLNEADVSIIKI